MKIPNNKKKIYRNEIIAQYYVRTLVFEFPCFLKILSSLPSRLRAIVAYFSRVGDAELQ